MRVRLRGLVGVVAGLLTACGEEPTVPVPLVVELEGNGPVDYRDEDNDGLLEIVLSVSGPESLALVEARVEATGFPDTGTVMLPGQSEFTGGRLTIEESLDRPFFIGRNRMMVAFDDLILGRSVADTVVIEVPRISFLRQIVTGLAGGLQAASGIGFCEDDLTVIVAARTHLALIDGEALELDEVIEPPQPSEGAFTSEMEEPLCIPGEDVVYIGDTFVARFDRNARRWLPNVEGESRATALRQSRRDPNILYAAEDAITCGPIGIIDRAANQRTGFFPDPFEFPCSSARSMALLGMDERIFTARGSGPPMLVYDPRTETITDSLFQFRNSLSIDLSTDEQHLYMADRTRGLLDIDPGALELRRELKPPNDVGFTAVSPSGRWVWLTGVGEPTETFHFLVDTEAWQVVAELPRTSVGPSFSNDRQGVFTSDERLFVINEFDVDVYLVRRIPDDTF